MRTFTNALGLALRLALRLTLILIFSGEFHVQAETNPAGTKSQENSPSTVGGGDSSVVFGRIFAPDGFDSNDNAQIVAEGEFRSSCSDVGRTSLQIDRSRFRITVGAAVHLKTGACSQGHFTFHRAISFGKLVPGQWTIKDAVSDAPLGRVEVKNASSNPEVEPKYAAVEKVYSKVGPQSAQLMVTGNYLNSCSGLSEVRVQIQQDVIVLEPIVQTSAGNNCVKGKFPFSSWTSLDFLKPGRFLIHVRTAQGQSLNSIIDVPGDAL